VQQDEVREIQAF